MVDAIKAYIAAEDVDEKIEALRQAVGFEGTHSIIDIPSTAALTRVEGEEIVHRFGSEPPALAAVRAAAMDLTDLVHQRFCAVWLTAIDEHGAAWICFVGVSGD